MKRSIATLVATALLTAFPFAAVAAPLFYDLLPARLSGGFVVSGVIETDGTLGDIDATNIESFTWSATDGTTTYTQSVPLNTNTLGGGLLNAKTGSLAVIFPTDKPFPDTSENRFHTINDAGVELTFKAFSAWDSTNAALPLRYFTRVELNGATNNQIAFVEVNLGIAAPTDPYIIAQAQAFVPEPSSLALAAFGFAGLLALGCRRNLPHTLA